MPLQTALNATQKAQGGKLIDFHGWEMAVQFSGINAEHQAVRSACGAFDLGHMGRLRVFGAGALRFLARHVCRALEDILPGQVRYGLALAEDGTVEDDVLISCEREDSFHVVVNASNKDKIVGLWKAALIQTATPATIATAPAVRLDDLSAREGMIAVQGPTAAALLAGMGLDGRHLAYYHFADLLWQGTPVRLSRTGYTGEDGFECFLPTTQAEPFWNALIAAGAVPCGLGCRDTLRLEAGMPLYGNELDRSVTPVEAGLSFAVNKHGGFIGDAVVLEQIAQGPTKKLVGLVVPDKRVPRHGYAVIADGKAVGVITSGTLSPTLGKAIGMAYVPASLASIGSIVAVDIRGTHCAAEVVAMPFYKRAKPTNGKK